MGGGGAASTGRATGLAHPRDRRRRPGGAELSGHREAAFGARPGALVAGGAGPYERWLAAVALGGQGRYAAAATLLRGLMAGPGVPPGLAAHAAVTRASHLRQLGGHAAARGLDAYALRRAGTAPPEPALEADGADPPAARADALVGLAADAVGLGEPELAERLLAAAAAQAHPSWRCRVRVGWVQAELALARGRPAEAVEPARLAFAAARRAGSLRHVVKSGIVLAVARAAADPAAAPEAVTELDRAAATAESCGLLPLLWPARLAAADLLAAGAGATPGDTPNGASTRRRAAITAMRVIHRRSDPIGRRLIGESRWFGAT